MQCLVLDITVTSVVVTSLVGVHVIVVTWARRKRDLPDM